MFNLQFSKMMKDIQWSFISVATASLAHLLLRIILGRELGPSGLGLYTLVFTIYTFGMQFAGFGIGIALTKYAAEHHNNLPLIKEFISSGIIGSVISGSMILVLTYLLSEFISLNLFHNSQMIFLLKITAFCFPFIAIQKTVLGALNGLGEIKLYSFVNIIQNLSIVIFSIFLVLIFNMGVKGAVIGFIVPTILVGIFSLIFTKDFFMIPSSFRTVLKELLYFGFYIVLTNSLGMINAQIDSLMVGHFMSATDVGLYSVAILFAEGLILIPDSVQTVTTPAIAKYYGKKDYPNIIKLIQNSVSKVFCITILFSLIFLLFGQIFIEIIFKKEYLPAYYPLLILLIGYSIYSPVLSVNGALSSVGRVNVMFKVSTVSILINILLNILLIPKYGILGAAISTSTALIFTAVFRLYFIDRYVNTKKLVLD